MKISRPSHDWQVSPEQAIEIQKELAALVRLEGLRTPVLLAAGVDASFSVDESHCLGAVVLWDIKQKVIVEQHTAEAEINFPYIPGLLSFREAPALLDALRKLKTTPDVLICDGAGIAHQRRLGIASHLGVLTGLPSIGCAKKPLIGEYDLPGPEKRARTPITSKGERIGTVLRTSQGVKPVFVSVGHGLSLEEAEKIILACCRGYRLPEPLRLADHLASAAKSEDTLEKLGISHEDKKRR